MIFELIQACCQVRENEGERGKRTMPVRSITNEMDVVPALAPIKSKQPGVTNSLLYSGSRFVGHQKSKGNQYDVEVILQVRNKLFIA